MIKRLIEISNTALHTLEECYVTMKTLVSITLTSNFDCIENKKTMVMCGRKCSIFLFTNVTNQT